MVHQVLFLRRGVHSKSLGKIVETWTCKLVMAKIKIYVICVNLTTSGGIGPIQSQDKTAKKGRW